MTDMKTCLELTKKQLDEILLGDEGTTLPLLQERYFCLQQSASVLLNKYKGMTSYKSYSIYKHLIMLYIHVIL